MGLVLIYKASGVFNFAQGEFGTVAIYGTYISLEILHIPYFIALLIGLVAAVERRPAHRAVRHPPALRRRRECRCSSPRQASPCWPSACSSGARPTTRLRFLAAISSGTGSLDRCRRSGSPISDQKLITMAVLIAAAVLLFLFFKSPDLGLAVLAASQEPIASRAGRRQRSSDLDDHVGARRAARGRGRPAVRGPERQFTPGSSRRRADPWLHRGDRRRHHQPSRSGRGRHPHRRPAAARQPEHRRHHHGGVVRVGLRRPPASCCSSDPKACS